MAKVRCEACGHADCKGWLEGQPVHDYRGKGHWHFGCHCDGCTRARNESGGFMGALADHLSGSSQLPVEPKKVQALWQPIATAPRDGTFVLTRVGPWQPCITHFATYDGKTRWGSNPEGFMEEDHFLQYWHEVSYEPTHWMPLPDMDLEDAIERAYRNGFQDGERAPQQHAREAEWPVGEAEVVIYDPDADLIGARGPRKIIDASIGFMRTAQIGEEAELSGFTRLECVGGPFEKRYADRLIGGVGVCFDMNKSGCRLAWEYCFGDEPMPDWFAAVEDRDLWRFALPATKEICISIRSHPRDFQVWDGFDAGELAAEGAAIRRYVEMIVSNICDTAFVESIGGHSVPVAACSYDFVSETANQLLQRNPDAPFAACIIRSYDGVTYSLRSMDDRMDVSEIAKAHGGGGHRNAAGFRAKVTPPETREAANG